MRILSIESSCDETSAAIVTNGTVVDSLVIASSQYSFSESGGVIPESAARKQLEYIVSVINEAFTQANLSWSDIDTIAVTTEPGLTGSLLVGTTAARTLAAYHQKPLREVHHTWGHLSSVFLERDAIALKWPILALSASGGHTEIWHRLSHTENTLISKTRDDAAGEAFDKGAAMLGLPYPGGPAIAQLAESGDQKAFSFPLPLRNDDSLDYSFAGLKTSLKYTLRDLGDLQEKDKANLAASYQYALCKHLIHKLVQAHKQYPVDTIHLIGGVSANVHLRAQLSAALPGVTLLTPIKNEYCTDNAAMIGAAAYFCY